MNDYVSVPDASSLDIANAITIEFWTKLNTNKDFTYFVNKWRWDTAGSAYGVVSHASGNVRGWISNGITNNSVLSQTTLTTGTWYHVVFTWDGTTNANGMKIYINGKLENQFKATIAAMQDVVGPVNIGIGGVNTINGFIDDVHIYSSALTKTEIKQMYAQTAPKYQIAQSESSK